ncbi:hypothetical protein SYNPS1DRAFT_21338 [Syncephalis pseudoplumigaleata]|uniref:Anaphase-promoting complex subunit 5 n=1 Tax=Syncephalis pseudoplumigaleata TaxID=1712513 RepID=A0A4V1J221_9FUNG|nr:hypothetical protein SYNPS1DRAFT_21338 [Syncephalis pseudoplumigaleata]|eukprot:RKP27039.1 hypothetical protein SYNPS1DRAFT_21338 [Syncephalis pseudoplumigaleata]
MYYLERRDYHSAASTLYRFFDYDNWKLGSWYAIAALNVALCQTDGRAMLNKAGALEVALGHQLHHQVTAYIGGMPATLLGFSLSICLTLDRMGLGEMAAEMARDIAVETRSSDDHAILATAGELLERAQEVFTELDERDMLNEALYLQCATFHARGMFEERNRIARRLQQLADAHY